MRFTLGVVDVVYWPVPVEERARRAAADGFAHIDVLVDDAADDLALPVGCPTAFPKPVPGWCSTPAYRDGPDMWDRTVAAFRAAPGALLEPWKGAVVNSLETCRSMMEAVPGLRLLVDTGHVADWGGDRSSSSRSPTTCSSGRDARARRRCTRTIRPAWSTSPP